jgi:hypothetical protein
MPDAEAILLTLLLPRCRIDSQPCRSKVARSRDLKLRGLLRPPPIGRSGSRV